MRKKNTKAVRVTLRKRMLDTGKESLYLDFYPAIADSAGNQSRRESLGMYVFPLKNKQGNLVTDKNGNYRYNNTDTEAIRLAEAIRNNRQNELDKANIYTDAESWTRMNLTDWFKKVMVLLNIRQYDCPQLVPNPKKLYL